MPDNSQPINDRREQEEIRARYRAAVRAARAANQYSPETEDAMREAFDSEIRNASNRAAAAEEARMVARFSR